MGGWNEMRSLPKKYKNSAGEDGPFTPKTIPQIVIIKFYHLGGIAEAYFK